MGLSDALFNRDQRRERKAGYFNPIKSRPSPTLKACRLAHKQPTNSRGISSTKQQPHRNRRIKKQLKSPVEKKSTVNKRLWFPVKHLITSPLSRGNSIIAGRQGISSISSTTTQLQWQCLAIDFLNGRFALCTFLDSVSTTSWAKCQLQLYFWRLCRWRLSTTRNSPNSCNGGNLFSNSYQVQLQS